MEAMQTLNPADVWEVVQKAIVWLAGIGILEFQSGCINHRRHTKEEFDHIIDILAKYDKYIKDHKLTNGQVDVAHEYILEIYKECMRTNDFALIKTEPEET